MRPAVIACVVVAVGGLTALAQNGTSTPTAAPRAYDPFSMRRAMEAPTAADRAALERRTQILKWLAARRVAPPRAHPSRSPFRPGPPANRPPAFTPPGGGVGTNPGGNTTGAGKAPAA